LNLADERKITSVSGHENEPVFSGGRSDQAVVQETAAETSRAQMSTLNQSSHNERRARPGGVAGGNDAPEIVEGSNQFSWYSR
jgi:hypothetical protein